ncbi:hypothetical protein [Thermococcus sp.]|uniref:hypothetical protein n=1 Tax=Thermococcus sp. TaxID=35749 RepID=UPI00262C659E|nr:hypothetical protein [Thermococcus sp.]
MDTDTKHSLLSFLAGMLAAMSPWTALLVGIAVYANKNKFIYYSTLKTSMLFLLGGAVGALFGYFLLGDTFLTWWTSSKGITSVLIGMKLWVPVILFGAAVIGILRAKFGRPQKSGGHL